MSHLPTPLSFLKSHDIIQTKADGCWLLENTGTYQKGTERGMEDCSVDTVLAMQDEILELRFSRLTMLGDHGDLTVSLVLKRRV